MKNGVCALSFDRKDIEMNKFGVGCLEAQFHVFEARTQHPKKVRCLGAHCLIIFRGESDANTDC